MASYVPFRNTVRYLRRQSHENPVIFYSVVIGLAGPAMVMVVPSIRDRLGYRSPPPIPTTYPLPKRARRQVEGYEDDS